MSAKPRLYDRCVSHAQGLPSRAAIVTGKRDIDYDELVRLINAGAAFFTENGIDRDATAGLTIKDETEHPVATLNLFTVGACQITLASHDRPAMRRDLSDRVGVTHVVTDDETCEGEDRQLVWRSAPVLAADVCGSGREGTLFLRTSGTTGKTNILEFAERQTGDTSRHCLRGRPGHSVAHTRQYSGGRRRTEERKFADPSRSGPVVLSVPRIENAAANFFRSANSPQQLGQSHQAGVGAAVREGRKITLPRQAGRGNAGWE
jgi:hypothetical protein